jgi:xanthine dehydrogenase molybdopterin-binding subunit B
VLQIVFSTTANAKLLSLNPAAALAARGVAGFFSAADIPGKNSVRRGADVAAASPVPVQMWEGRVV